MTEYTRHFPAHLTAEQKRALAWKIDRDYSESDAIGSEPKHFYIRVAMKFYTRTPRHLDDIVQKYRAYRSARKSGIIRFFAASLSSPLAVS